MLKLIDPIAAPAPASADFRADVLAGLSVDQKWLPCKWFYDEAGSRLFERITQLEEYYQTRAELRITRDHLGDIATAVGRDALLVEYGSGMSTKTELLLARLNGSLAGYVPIDISPWYLKTAAAKLERRHPTVEILPLCADYTGPMDLPEPARLVKRRVAYFPGSTIGNFDRPAAAAFLRGVAETVGPGGGLMIGVDLVKEPSVLHAAYNDADGVTAAFNLNLLARANRELGGTFELDAWAHHALYNPPAGRIEMHLVSLADQSAIVSGNRFDFAEGESIFTEVSHKYSVAGFARLARDAGWSVDQVWTDERRLFSVQYLTLL